MNQSLDFPVEFILYVQDQSQAKLFYQSVLNLSPSLDVPGMTEFQLTPGVKLGIMPLAGIAKIICPAMPNPGNAAGIPRCELYLKFTDARSVLQRAQEAGAVMLSELSPRDWGDTVAYVADLDGHILAIAQA